MHIVCSTIVHILVTTCMYVMVVNSNVLIHTSFSALGFVLWSVCSTFKFHSIATYSKYVRQTVCVCVCISQSLQQTEVIWWGDMQAQCTMFVHMHNNYVRIYRHVCLICQHAHSRIHTYSICRSSECVYLHLFVWGGGWRKTGRERERERKTIPVTCI